MKHYYSTLFFFFILICTTSFTFAQKNDAEDYYVKGEVYAETAQYYDAIMSYEIAIAKDSLNPKYLYKLALVYIKTDEKSEAKSTFLKAVEVDNNYIDAHLKLALLYQEEKNLEKYIFHINEAYKVSTDADKQLAYKTRIINILEKRNMFSEAGPHINDAKKIAPNNNYILYMEAKYHNYITKNHELAKSSMQMAIAQMEEQKGKAHEHYYYELGVAHHSLEDYQNANIAFKEISNGKLRSKISSMTPEYLYQIASAHYQIYNLDVAIENLHSIIKMNNSFEPAYDLLIELEENKLNRSEVIKLLEHKVTIQKDNTEKVKILADLIDFELKFGDYDNAFRHLKEFEQSEIPLPNVKFMQARAHYFINEKDSAIVILQDLIENNGPKIKYKSSFLLGVIYVEQKKYKDAKVAFSKPYPSEFNIAAKDQLKKIKALEKESLVKK